MKLRLVACYEGRPHGSELTPFHPLNGAMREDELFSFLVALSEFDLEGKTPATPSDAISVLLNRDDGMLAGGLVAMKNEYRLFPGCCHGLESWREWANLRKGGPSPWLGHDPDAWIDASGERAVLHNGRAGPSESLEVEYSEISEAFANVEAELDLFAARMESWLVGIDAVRGGQLSDRLREWFWIGQKADERAASTALEYKLLVERLKSGQPPK